MNIRFLVLVLVLPILIQGCSKVDDYILGKDNTPQPKDLRTIEPQLKVAQNWTASVGKAHKGNEYLKLKPVIQGNIIYTADTNGLVQAVNKNDGKVRWSTQLKHGIVSGPTVAEG